MKIQVYENNKIIKTFRSVKALEKYMRTQQLQNGLPLKYKKINSNSFHYSYEDMTENTHTLLLTFTT